MNTKQNHAPSTETAGQGSAHEYTPLLDFDRTFGTYAQQLSAEQRNRLADMKPGSHMYDLFKQAEARGLGRWLDQADPSEAERVLAGLTLGRAPQPAPSPEQERSAETDPIGLPADFDEHNYDDITAQIAQDARLAPVRQEAKRRLGIGWIKGAGLFGNMAAYAAQIKERREERKEAIMSGMNEGEKIAYLEACEKRRARRLNIGGVAIMAATTVWAGFKIKYGVESFSGGGVATASQDVAQAAHDNQSGAGMNVSMGRDPHAALELLKLNQYNSSDSSFYDYNHKTFRGDFGPALVGSDKDGTMGFGFDDWMSRNKHEPNGLANLVSGLKLEGHGDSMNDRNALADMLDGSKKQQMHYDQVVQDALRDPKRFKVESMDITTLYDTTYEHDVNGNLVIASQRGVNHGGTMFKITNLETKEVTYWRKDCGGYQQIWPHEQVVGTQTYHSNYYVQQPGRVITHQPGRVVEQHPPVVETTPPPENPPVETTPPPEETPPPPVVPEQKNELENSDGHVAGPIRQNGELAGSGPQEARKDMTRAGGNYSPPKKVVDNDNSVAPGAKPGTGAGSKNLHGNGESAQSGTTGGADRVSGGVGED